MLRNTQDFITGKDLLKLKNHPVRRPKARLRSLKSGRTKLLNLKVTVWEDSRMQDLADQYADGNKSEWVRYASLNFRPRKSDLVPLDETEDGSPLVIQESTTTPT